MDDNSFYQQISIERIITMTTPIAANANVQQQVAPACVQVPDFKPSYNAVQLNISQPTLNAASLMPPPPSTASQEWNA